MAGIHENMQDLTVIYLTANEISGKFKENIQRCLMISLPHDVNFIAVSKQPVSREDWGFDITPNYSNLVFTVPRHHVNIYREALAAVKEAKTKYVAIVEDDVLYSAEHFKKRPRDPKSFAYNRACWSIYTWSKPPIFSYTGRRNFGQLICERDLFIEAFEERFAKYPTNDLIDNAIWAEPGKYERNLGVSIRQAEDFYTDPANIMFTHPEGLSYHTLGEKKRLAPIRALEIPYWGRAEEVIKFYE